MSIKTGRRNAPVVISNENPANSQFGDIKTREKSYREIQHRNPYDVVQYEPTNSTPSKPVPPEPSRQRYQRYASFEMLRLNPNLVLGLGIVFVTLVVLTLKKK